MLTDRADARRRGRPLISALLLSLLFHAALLPLVLWMLGWRLPMPQHPAELTVTSSALRLERRSVPQPRSHPARRSPVHLQPPPQRHVLARTVRHAPPQPPPTHRASAVARSFSERLAQEQRAYTREVARLNAADNPHSIATLPPRSPASYRKAYFDTSGRQDIFAGHGLLIPLKHWYENGRSCYYVRYTFEYPDGASEAGNVPWPICYPRNADQMLGPAHPIPLPTPMPGFRVAAGTYLTPLLRFYYDHFQGPPPQGQ